MRACAPRAASFLSQPESCRAPKLAPDHDPGVEGAAVSGIFPLEVDRFADVMAGMLDDDVDLAIEEL